MRLASRFLNKELWLSISVEEDLNVHVESRI